MSRLRGTLDEQLIALSSTFSALSAGLADFNTELAAEKAARPADFAARHTQLRAFSCKMAIVHALMDTCTVLQFNEDGARAALEATYLQHTERDPVFGAAFITRERNLVPQEAIYPAREDYATRLVETVQRKFEIETAEKWLTHHGSSRGEANDCLGKSLVTFALMLHPVEVRRRWMIDVARSGAGVIPDGAFIDSSGHIVGIEVKVAKKPAKKHAYCFQHINKPRWKRAELVVMIGHKGERHASVDAATQGHYQIWVLSVRDLEQGKLLTASASVTLAPSRTYRDEKERPYVYRYARGKEQQEREKTENPVPALFYGTTLAELSTFLGTVHTQTWDAHVTALDAKDVVKIQDKAK